MCAKSIDINIAPMLTLFPSHNRQEINNTTWNTNMFTPK